MKSLETISNEITILEVERDFGDITPEDLEMLSILNLCYDLLTRTTVVKKIIIETDEQMQDAGFDKLEQKYGVPSNQLADFAFSIATKTGNINLRKLLYQITSQLQQQEIATKAGLRRQTIGDYLNQKTNIMVSNYESTINACLKK